MVKILLSIHVVAAILLIGPVAVTTSLFPRYVPQATLPSRGDRVERNLEAAQMLHRVTRTYGRVALVVPVVGLVLAMVQGRASEIWIVVAMALTAVAGALLILQIVPRQQHALWAPDDPQLRGLTMLAGIFNLLWAAVVVLMIVRPGSDYS